MVVGARGSRQGDDGYGDAGSAKFFDWLEPIGVGKIDSYQDGVVSLKRVALHCLLYTSDAADDLLCVDLGGRRIIKKKNIHTSIYIVCNTTHT